MVIIMKKTKLIFKFSLVILVFCCILSCATKRATEPATLVDNPNLDGVFKQAQQIACLKSLIIYKDGKLIRQAFYGTGDEYITHDVRSVTKSVTSLLIGIAIDKGFIKSIDQPLSDFSIPTADNIPAEKAKITIRNLLTMSSGFEWDETSSIFSYNSWIASKNQILYIIDKQLIDKPGDHFNYNSAAFHLLSVILSTATNMRTLDFAKKYLFDPLGFGEVKWETDNLGYNNGSAGLTITPHDMVKIGELLLNHGEYNRNRIVSAQWIDQSTTPQISTNYTAPFGTDYAFAWWIGENLQAKYIFANGYGGQFIVVAPSLSLVIVATNKWDGVKSPVIKDQWYKTLDLITNSVIAEFY
jgi:CubicO group peptidase (beta-lactamase class C family)